MTSSYSEASRKWVGIGSTSIVPPADYWTYVASILSPRQIDVLRELSDKRLNEFTPNALPPPKDTAIELLDRVTDSGWLEREQRHRCPRCEYDLTKQDAEQPECPKCGEAYSQFGGVTCETVYVRNLERSRDVDWVVAIHGMNTTGAWQEAFSWHISTTWGRSVPIAVYKYGIVIAGVIIAWRRRRLLRDLRDKLAALRHEAHAQGFSGKPDIIAHSFGTWLFGHLLLNELTRKSKEQLKFGRIILTGCVLRPDFDWKRMKDIGLVEDVLNHYGTKDSIVPMAHVTIWDSGPSGRRGFDGDQIINIRAEGYGHSDLFSIKKCVVNGKSFQTCTSDAGEMSHLEHSYKRYWRPFLTLPRQELYGLPDRVDPATKWRHLQWPLRGTVFPFFALPCVLVLIGFVVASIGKGLWEIRKVLTIVASVSAAGLASMVAAIAIMALWRRLRR
ncbi:hypothetical protein MJD09_03985 [bacterium]|nr:hypothetical protein [bacterium]